MGSIVIGFDMVSCGEDKERQVLSLFVLGSDMISRRGVGKKLQRI